MIGNDTGDACCTALVASSGMSGIPVLVPLRSLQPTMSSTLFRNSALVPTRAKSSAHALMIALRVSSALSFESMKSTTTLRPASPPLPLMYLPKPMTASREPANAPGASGVSTSAITAMRISSALTPTSVACGASLGVLAAPAPGTAAASTLATTASRGRDRQREPSRSHHQLPPNAAGSRPHAENMFML